MPRLRNLVAIKELFIAGLTSAVMGALSHPKRCATASPLTGMRLQRPKLPQIRKRHLDAGFVSADVPLDGLQTFGPALSA